MISLDYIKLGHVLQHEKSGTTWIILAIVDGSDYQMLPGTPLLLRVENKKRDPYVVMAGFNLEARCDDSVSCEFTLNSDFLAKYIAVNVEPVLNYNDMTF